MYKIACNFCNISASLGDIAAQESLPYYDRPIYSSDKSFVIQAKHRVADGHILLVTKRHFFSFSGVPNAEFGEVLLDFSKLYSAMMNVFKRVTVFEHGLASESASTCVEHAHLHFLPTDESIERILSAKFELMSSHDTLENAYNHLAPPYILIKEHNGRWNIFKIPDSIPGQYVCRLYLEAMGKPNKAWVDIEADDDSFKKTWHLLKGSVNDEK